ncbi:hypothetical protein ACFPN7_11875 [Amycolatopsis halotolerans]|uniref:hypothetical protein n=1 Tax=Amycolatopsis halotolerans TaxID=330083 RepID=UPI00361A9E20
MPGRRLGGLPPTLRPFDSLFSGAVGVNPEGVLPAAAGASKATDGLPFDDITVRRLLCDEPMASPGASILDRGLQRRGQGARVVAAPQAAALDEERRGGVRSTTGRLAAATDREIGSGDSELSVFRAARHRL